MQHMCQCNVLTSGKALYFVMCYKVQYSRETGKAVERERGMKRSQAELILELLQ